MLKNVQQSIVTHGHKLWLVAGFGLLFAFFWLVPITGDDFTFASYGRSIHDPADFISATHYMYTYINGRIIGNGTSLLLINHPVLSAAFRAAIVLFIIVCAAHLLHLKSLSAKLLLSVALFSVPITIFHQTYAWRAGFFNYVMPVALILTLFVLMKSRIEGRNQPDGYGRAAAAFSLAFMTAFFAENITLVMILLAISLLVWSWRKGQGISKSIIALLLGSLAGAYLMFESPVYRTVANGNDAYRHTGESATGYVAMIKDNLMNFSHLLVSYNTLLFIVITVACLLLARVTDAKRQKKLHHDWLGLACALSIGLGGLFLLFFDLHTTTVGSGKLQTSRVILESLIVALYFTAVVVTVWRYISNRLALRTGLSYLIAGLLFAAPLLIVKPFGGRNFYLSYVLFVLFAGTLIKYLTNDVRLIKRHRQALAVGAYGIFAFVCCFYLSIFSVIHLGYNRNVEAAERQINTDKHTIYLNRYPFRNYLQDPNNNTKAMHYIADCHCVYITCHGCNDIVIKYQ